MYIDLRSFTYVYLRSYYISRVPIYAISLLIYKGLFLFVFTYISPALTHIGSVVTYAFYLLRPGSYLCIFTLLLMKILILIIYMYLFSYIGLVFNYLYYNFYQYRHYLLVFI